MWPLAVLRVTVLTRDFYKKMYDRFAWPRKSDRITEVASLRASSPIWASEASRARTRERAAKPQGAVE